MNREERRKLGISKETAENYNKFNDPCTISEVVQIARGVAEDVVLDYKKYSAPLQVATSLQIEILRDLCISAGVISKDEFKEIYEKKVEEFNAAQRDSLVAKVQEEHPTMEASPSDIEVKKVD